jgi:hypothetical protein
MVATKMRHDHEDEMSGTRREPMRDFVDFYMTTHFR